MEANSNGPITTRNGARRSTKSSIEKASGAVNPKDPVHFVGLVVVGLMILGIISIFIVTQLSQ